MLITRILALQAQGMTTRQIAGEIGGLTKNAVVGLLYRARRKAVAVPAPPRRKPVRDPLNIIAAPPRKRPAVVVPAKPDAVPVTAPGEGVPLMQTRSTGCRWIVARDARGALYCDQPREGGRTYSWCAHHYKIGTRGE